MHKLLPFVLVVLLLPSCLLSRATGNEPLHPTKIDTLKPGSSTAADVANLLGAPTEVVQLGTRMAWRYDFTTAKVAGFSIIILTFLNSDTRADRAWLFFDANNVLLFASKTLEADDASYAMPWQSVHGGN
jgi:outer membrane protein assembly factor BamE (lipoprotein component of BamABCDE complex)